MVKKRKIKDRFLEEDMYEPIRDHLVDFGFTVHAEVNSCDVVARKGDFLLVVEMKRKLSLELIVQATDRQKMTDSVYLAVPRTERQTKKSKWSGILHLLRRLELGLMLVAVSGKSSFVEIVQHPLPFDRDKSKNLSKSKRQKIINEILGRNGDFNIGGSRGKKLMTAYRESSIFIACCLIKFGHLSPSALRKLGTDKKKTQSILSNNFYGWFSKKGKGIYCITESGKKDVSKYSELKNYYMDKIKQRLKDEEIRTSSTGKKP